MQQLDRLMFNKQYEAVLNSAGLSQLPQLDRCHEQLLNFKARLYYRLQHEKMQVQIFEQILQEMQKLPIPYEEEMHVERCMIKLLLSHFITSQPSDLEQQLQRLLQNLVPLQQLLTKPFYRTLHHYPFHACCIIQLYVRKLCCSGIEGTFIQQLSTLIVFHSKIYNLIMNTPNLVNGLKLMRSLYYILVHRLVSFYNNNLNVQYKDVLVSFCSMFGRDYKDLMRSKLKICLLYNILKILVGMHDQEKFDINVVFEHLGCGVPPTYRQKIFTLFFILNQLIDEKSAKLLNSVEREQSTVQTNLWTQLYIYQGINLHFIKLKLDVVVKKIITHRMASLLQFISLRYRLNQVTKKFIEKIYDSPFNDELQTIKLCFQMFNSEQFDKLSQLSSNVLSSEAGKRLKSRELLIVMCSIFKGVVMQNIEQGMGYAKMNHQDYLKNKSNVSFQGILNEQTLLAHVGFAYYNAARHSEYLSNRIKYYSKALENFLKSLQKNQENYLVTYSVSKVYLDSYDYESAYKYATAACKNNKDNWQPFALLACVYMCRKKHHKADLIIKELVLRHPKCPTLYYIRAYTETYKILQEVYTNEEVEASKFLGNQYYESYKERVLRSKDVRLVLQLLQRYVKMVFEKKYDEEPYDEQFLSRIRIQPDMIEDELTEREYFQCLKNCIELLLHLDQLALCDILVKAMMVERKSGNREYRYYKGKLHEKKKEKQQAMDEYSQLLLTQPYHPETLMSLSLLEMDLVKAGQEIELAGKFKDDDDFNYAKGMYLSRVGQFQRAHNYFLKEARVCWLTSLPDFMYYY